MKYVFLSIVTFLLYCTTVSAENLEAAKDLIQRQVGDRIEDITFNRISTIEGKDVFDINAVNGHVTLSASSPVAFCYAFHKYLREACLTMSTWSNKHLIIPETWPDYTCRQQISPYKFRYFLNVCTYGYTTPYWDWSRWAEEIDWMAMHGVNMPLASVAAEAIAERVWIKLGLTKEEIRQFFTGAAYLPWHRMGNLNTWDGPLTDEWQEQQIDLQHKIIDRMRELGMQPIIPTFAGFVPEAFTTMHPEIKYNHLEWGGFDERLNAFVLPPDSQYFETIGKMFVEEWENEFGKNKYYLSDSFNEMKLPVDPENKAEKLNILSRYGESIYRSITAGNPDAVWVTQGWTFGYQHDFWDNESLQALLSNVPDDKMIIIDLGNDYPKWVWHTEQTWKVHNGFYGKNWIFSYVPNFGGKTLMTGDLDMYASSSSDALKHPNRGNLIGFGSAPEGLENNEIVYELLADMAWTDESIDLDLWINDYCKSRYGSCPDKVKQAWRLFCNSAYSALRSYPRFTWQTVVPDKRRISITDFNEDFIHAIELFMECADELSGSSLYRNDAIELSAYLLAIKADRLYTNALHLDSIGNNAEASIALNKAIELLLYTDRLLASHPTTRLADWIKQARSYGSSIAEADSYEADAKRLITVWGGFQEDYAARFWSGLIKDYYIPRMKIYFSDKRDTLDQWENDWIDTPWINSTNPYSDPIGEAIKLINYAKNI